MKYIRVRWVCWNCSCVLDCSGRAGSSELGEVSQGSERLRRSGRTTGRERGWTEFTSTTQERHDSCNHQSHRTQRMS